MYRADTIVACATAPGRAAVAIVRLSGADAFAIADAVFRPARSRAPRPWCLHRGHVVDASGGPVDDALAVRMPGPRSYTGEDVVELHCHGSPLVVERLIAACQSHGARTAERGEFSRRAVLNGRMDLAQAEAVADLIDARASAGVRAAWRQLQGALSTWLAGLRSRLVGVLADVEANVDFSDEELPQENLPARIAVLEEVKAEIAATLAGFAAARREREGHVVAFCGRPNVGKSSLVNRLLGEERMIVSEEPGTTRDAVEETIDLDGMAFVLTDTAGVRASPSRAESAAVTRALDRAAAADITVVVVDGSRALEDEDRDLLARSHDGVTIAVVNKHDLPSRLDREELVASCRPGVLILRVSALTGEGCEHLARTFAEVAASDAAGERPPVAISRLRHRAALEAASRSLAEAIALVGGARDNELVAMELRAALGELASITDPVDNEAVLERIFREFCVGK